MICSICNRKIYKKYKELKGLQYHESCFMVAFSRSAQNRREASTERSNSEKIKRLDGLSWKIKGVGVNGVPDRINILPIPKEHQYIINKYIKFTEEKTKNGRLSVHQKQRIKELKELGLRVTINYGS